MNRGQGWRDVRRDRTTKKKKKPEKEAHDASTPNAVPAVWAKPGEMYAVCSREDRALVPVYFCNDAYDSVYVSSAALILVISAPEMVKRRYRHKSANRQFVWTCAVFVEGRAGWMRTDDFGEVVTSVSGNGRRT